MIESATTTGDVAMPTSRIEVGDTVRSRGADYLYTVTEVKEMVVGGHVGHLAWIEAKDGGRTGWSPFGELELISKR